MSNIKKRFMLGHIFGDFKDLIARVVLVHIPKDATSLVDITVKEYELSSNGECDFLDTESENAFAKTAVSFKGKFSFIIDDKFNLDNVNKHEYAEFQVEDKFIKINNITSTINKDKFSRKEIKFNDMNLVRIADRDMNVVFISSFVKFNLPYIFIFPGSIETFELNISKEKLYRIFFDDSVEFSTKNSVKTVSRDITEVNSITTSFDEGFKNVFKYGFEDVEYDDNGQVISYSNPSDTVEYKCEEVDEIDDVRELLKILHVNLPEKILRAEPTVNTKSVVTIDDAVVNITREFANDYITLSDANPQDGGIDLLYSFPDENDEYKPLSESAKVVQISYGFGSKKVQKVIFNRTPKHPDEKLRVSSEYDIYPEDEGFRGKTIVETDDDGISYTVADFSESNRYPKVKIMVSATQTEGDSEDDQKQFIIAKTIDSATGRLLEKLRYDIKDNSSTLQFYNSNNEVVIDDIYIDGFVKFTLVNSDISGSFYIGDNYTSYTEYADGTESNKLIDISVDNYMAIRYRSNIDCQVNSDKNHIYYRNIYGIPTLLANPMTLQYIARNFKQMMPVH